MARSYRDVVTRLTLQIQGWEAGIKRLEQSNERVANSVKSIESRTSNFAKNIAGAFSIAAVKNVGSFLSSLQQLDNRLKGISGSSQAYAENLNYIRDVSSRFGLAQETVQKGFTNLAAAAQIAGKSVREAQSEFTALATAASGAGLSSAELEGVLLGWTQLSGNAVVNLEDLRQVVDRLPGGLNLALKAMQDMTGNTELTGDAFKKLVSQGAVTTDKFLPALTKQLQSAFGASAQKNAESMASNITRFNNALREVARLITESAPFRILTETMEGLNSVLGLLNENLDVASAKLQGLQVQTNPEIVEQAAKVAELTQRRIDLEQKLKQLEPDSRAYSRLASEIAKVTANLSQQRGVLDRMQESWVKAEVAAKETAKSTSDIGGTQIAGTADEIDKIAKALNLTAKGAENLRKFFPAISQAAQETGVDITTIIGKISVETGKFTAFVNPNSSARGPAQIVAKTAKYLADKYGFSYEALRTGTDEWVQNIRAGAAYLKEQYQGVDSELEALAKYFLGPGDFKKYGLDYTTGPNAGLTGRGYGTKIISEANKVRAVLGDTGDVTAKLTEIQNKQRESLKALEDQYRAYGDEIQAIDAAQAKLNESLSTAKTTSFGSAAELSNIQAIEAELAKLQEREDTLVAEQAKLSASITEMGGTAKDAGDGLKSVGEAGIKAAEGFAKANESAESMVERLKTVADAVDPMRSLREEYELTINAINDLSLIPDIEKKINLDLSDLEQKVTAKFEVDVSNIESAKTAIGNLGISFEELKIQGIDAVNDAMSSFIDDLVEGTASAEDAVKSLIKQVAKLALQFAVTNAFKGITGLFGNAKGNAYDKLALPYGVYTAPTVFALPEAGPLKRYAKGGILGERGAEAVMPLARMANGDLGVQSSTVTVQPIVNITETTDTTKQGTVKTSTNSNGESVIDVLIAKVKAEFQSDVGYGGTFSKVMEQQYGLRRSLGAY